MRRWINNLDRPSWKMGLLLAIFVLSGVALAAPGIDSQTKGRVPKPAIERGKGDKCVKDVEFMRKNHMTLLKHQRDETVRNGIRTKQFSLNGCIDCHASQKTGRVVGSDENFCQGCHSYAAVQLDCFECHASKPKSTAYLMGTRDQGIEPVAASAPISQLSRGPASGNSSRATVQ
jgi:hypothetical protein